MNFFLEMKFRFFLLSLFSGVVVIIMMVIVESYNWLSNKNVNIDASPKSILRREMGLIRDGNKIKESAMEMPILMWWTRPPVSLTKGVKHCSDNAECFFTTNREHHVHPEVRGIFFYGTHFKATDIPLPRSPITDWALLHEESPKNNPLFDHEDVVRLFNHTATFKRYSDLPLTTQYLPNIEYITDGSYFVPLDVKNRLLTSEKSDGLAPIVYVASSCDCPSNRDNFVEELSQFVAIDSYGSCLHNKDLPQHLNSPTQFQEDEFLRILAKYKFMLTLENAICEDYVSEKVWTALKVGAVPVYLGAPNIRDWLPNYESSAIIVSDMSNNAADVANTILYLNSNDDEYKKYLGHKAAHNGDELIQNDYLIDHISSRGWKLNSADFINKFECMVCERVWRNKKFVKMGFRSLSYNAQGDHYGCPAPTDIITGEEDINSWWYQHWQRTRYEASVLRDLVESGSEKIEEDDFYKRVLNIIKSLA